MSNDAYFMSDSGLRRLTARGKVLRDTASATNLQEARRAAREYLHAQIIRREGYVSYGAKVIGDSIVDAAILLQP